MPLTIKKMISCACFAPKVIDDAKNEAKQGGLPTSEDRAKPASWLQRFRSKLARNNKPNTPTEDTGIKRVRVRGYL